MSAPTYAASAAEPHLVDAVQAGTALRSGAAAATIDENLRLSTAGLKSYFFAGWEPLLVDLLVVAAAIEFCDVVHRRPARGWARRFDVHVAVHAPERWRRPDVLGALRDAVGFLTGDLWTFSFEERRQRPFLCRSSRSS